MNEAELNETETPTIVNEAEHLIAVSPLMPYEASEPEPLILVPHSPLEITQIYSMPLVRPKAPLLRRAAADFIDRLIPLPFIVALFWPWAIVVIAYDLLRDGKGASIGKRLMGLHTVMVSPNPELDGGGCSFGRSILRNLFRSAARLCYFSGVLLPVGLAYDLLECALVCLSPTGRRIGDLAGGTQVVSVEAKGGNF